MTLKEAELADDILSYLIEEDFKVSIDFYIEKLNTEFGINNAETYVNLYVKDDLLVEYSNENSTLTKFINFNRYKISSKAIPFMMLEKGYTERAKKEIIVNKNLLKEQKAKERRDKFQVRKDIAILIVALITVLIQIAEFIISSW